MCNIDIYIYIRAYDDKLGPVDQEDSSQKCGSKMLGQFPDAIIILLSSSSLLSMLMI